MNISLEALETLDAIEREGSFSAAARALHDRGWRVEVFDKARGPAGRTSTRRVEAHTYDHGAQYFTAREPEFRAAVAGWREAGQAGKYGQADGND
jgi:predicted NAD/FAD-dependent oxidoreductase